MNDMEFDVAADGEIADGEMRQFTAGETEVLVARVDGRYHAVGATCPHYGAPLADGVLCGERLVCPWHQATFDVTTGRLLEPPALDGLPRYGVRVEGGRVVVAVPTASPAAETPETEASAETADARVFVVVGGGAAGYSAAATLREEGFRGRVVMITREDRLPYDRPNLSKDYLAGHAQPEWMPLRPETFYVEHDIEVVRGREVVALDARAKTVTLDDGRTLGYTAALVATGSVARRPAIPGVDLTNVLTLRGFDDADAIVQATQGASRAAVVGASFIGMEVAASLVERGLAVTVVAPSSAPFEKTVGDEIGAMFRRLHEGRGVRFELGTSVVRFEGDGAVERVVLANGAVVDVDLVVVGAGVDPATGFLRGVALGEDGGVLVDAYLCAGDGLWAAGDIARFPDPLTGEPTRIEHWRTAEQQGRVAARNMAGLATPHTSVPFFWTNQFGESLQYVGHASGWDEIIVDGDVDGRDFLALYVRGDRIAAAAASRRDAVMGAIAEAMRLGRMPSPDAARRGGVDWLGLATAAAVTLVTDKRSHGSHTGGCDGR
jgi:NADPH-dependent 2,4-dienoyl-CoA reductase/sulfur reductase-like enzyme/nitrite reductase/ring-hydroxylating ferredoxin subunit